MSRKLKRYIGIYAGLLLFVEPLTWFALSKKLEALGIWPNILLLVLPAVLVAIGMIVAWSWDRIFRPQLTDNKPRDGFVNSWRWHRMAQQCEYSRLLSEKEANIMLRWPGVGLDKFLLKYNPNDNYESYMTEIMENAIENWRKENSEKYEGLVNEPCGLQVRLDRYSYIHSEHKHKIELIPTKYLYYVTLHARLWENRMRELRKYVFDDSLNFLYRQSRPRLPSHFALHMAIVSSDGKIIIRQRTGETELYSNAWESSIGEFMHGPKHPNSPDFVGNEPSLKLFCKRAVKEEINYSYAKTDEFTLHGFGIEYRTLAPKLFVVFKSRENMTTLLKQGTPEDAGQRMEGMELTPEIVGQQFSKRSGVLWTPSSRIITLIALESTAENQNDAKLRIKEFRKKYN